MTEKRVAYCIISHSIGEQLKLLLETLGTDKASSIYLHVDAKCDIPEEFLVWLRSKRVTLVDRIRVNWGGFSMISATSNLFMRAMQSDANCAFVLLSGTCFPLRSTNFINSELISGPGDRFALWEIASLPDGSIKSPSSLNVEKRFFMDLEALSPTRSKWHRIAFKLFNTLNTRLPYRYLPSEPIVKGSQWFSASRETIEMFLSADLSLVNFLKKTFAPDETFFQTLYWRREIAAGAPPQFVGQREHLQGTHFIPYHSLETRSFGERASKHFDARAMTSRDVSAALASTALFARKCSIEVCKEILNHLD